MNVTVYNDPTQFLEVCKPVLEQHAAVNNGVLSMIALIEGGSDIFELPAWQATIEDNGRIIGCACHSKPDGLQLTVIPDEAVPLLFAAIDRDIGMPHRILANENNSRRLAQLWKEERGATVTLSTEWHVYQLHKVVPPKRRANGELRKARNDELDLVANWGRHYGDEKPAPVDVSDFMVRKLRDGNLFVWDDEGARTILALSGHIDKCSRISAIYTPPEFRGRGYGSTATADLSQRQLDKGCEVVTLSAMIGDPSERIYIALGYEEISTRLCYLLEK
ncbi:MAG: hypothetical protein KJP16_06565 [Gammaproteobacteria bacterium]|nr:hypothetical protein [Gammaproteobacteria bacterium]